MNSKLPTDSPRCDWVSRDPLYIQYHDTEWGVPQYDSLALFEKICLEGQQAGLSWITVLKKREHYRHCFHHFDPEKIIAMTDADIDHLMQDTGLIRNRLKLNAIVTNARAYQKMQAEGESFSEFIWSFVQHTPVVNRYQSIAEVPAVTETAEQLSKALKKKGFKFVGPTICYAFMQSMGLVNDHLTTCICHPGYKHKKS